MTAEHCDPVEDETGCHHQGRVLCACCVDNCAECGAAIRESFYGA